ARSASTTRSRCSTHRATRARSPRTAVRGSRDLRRAAWIRCHSRSRTGASASPTSATCSASSSARRSRMRVRDWIDQRTGWRAFGHAAFGEPVRGGASWAYVFGSALALTVAMQVVTGVLLALFYSPSTTSAWGSIHYIQHDVLLGWFVRGVHHY